MHRRTRLGLVAAALLIVVGGAYAGFWCVVAGRIEAGVEGWAETERTHNFDLSWQGLSVAGFPLHFRVELADARLRQTSGGPGLDVHAPVLSGTARPWNFRIWRLAAIDGLSATLGPPQQPNARLRAPAAGGYVTVGDRDSTVWLSLGKPSAEAGIQLAAGETELWLTLPAHPPKEHTEPTIGVALEVRQLTLPVVPAPFLNPVDEVAFGMTLMGPVPATPLRQAAESWRDAGGTLELDRLALRWGGLQIAGSGTLALDAELQPIGGFSGAVQGYEELMTALVKAGRIKPGEAGLARLALAMLGKAGPNGQPQITTSFTIQNGAMYLGPAKLGPVPRIDWK